MTRKKSRLRKLYPRRSLTKDQEEKEINEMYDEGYSFPEIAEVKHKSITTIKEITDRYQSSKLPKEKTRASEAYKLFGDGKGRLEVAIELGLDSRETIKHFEGFIELTEMDEFNKIYNEAGSDLLAVVSLYKNLKAPGITIDQIPSIQDLASQVGSLVQQRSILGIERDKTYQAIVGLSTRLTQCQKAVDSLKIEERRLLTRIEELSREELRLNSVLNSIKSGDLDYKKIDQIVSDLAKSILNSRNEAIATAIAATILALKSDYNRIVTLFLWPSTGNQYVQLVKGFGELVQQIWDQIEAQVKNRVRVAIFQRVGQIANQSPRRIVSAGTDWF